MQRLLSWTMIALALGLWTSRAPAQEFRSTLNGVVTDSQGSVVPLATVQAANVDTGTNFTTVSGDAGQFTLPLLPPGRYTVTTRVAGFKRFSQENVVVTANQRISLNIILEIGDVTETVVVSAGAPLLATGTASMGQSIVADFIGDLPMAGRAPMVMARLAFGVTDQSSPAYNTRPFDTSGTSTYAMGGGRSSTNELLMDGTPNMSNYRCVAYNAPIDAVEEVKIEVFQADAAYGNTAGGTINIISKTGTNRFHGTLAEYNQTSALAANLFFTNAAGIKKGVARYNQWGGSIGGPLIIPKVYNGSNKLFWFFAYDGVTDLRPVPGSTTFTVPTAAMRTGDFSGLLAFGSAYQLYDPATAVAQGSRRQRQPLPGNLIPQSRINPIAKNYLPYYPLPNQSGVLNGQQNNYLSTPNDHDRYWNFLGRMDVNLSDLHKVNFSAHSNFRNVDYQQYWPGPATGLFRYRIASGGTLDDVYGFGPTMWLNTRIGWTRFNDPDQMRSNGFNITSLGFPSSMAAASLQPLMPGVTFTDPTKGVGGGNSYNDPFDTEQLFVSLNKVAGSHSLKVGTDVRRLRQNSIVFGNSAGTFAFGPNWMNGPLDNSSAAPLGQGMASLLLGLPTDGSFDVNSYSSYKSWYASVFIQDDWRPFSNLTVNVGLRYEKETAATERYNRSLVGYDFAAPNALTSAARQAYAANPIPQLPASQFNPVGGPIFASSSHPDIYSTPNRAFSPRLGLAYKPDAFGGRSVIRAGIGMFYQSYGTLPFGQEPTAAGVNQPGFSQTTPVVATNDGYLTPYATLSNPFPGGIIPPPGATLGLNTNQGKTINYINPTLDAPYLVRWTLSAQREVAQNLVVEFGYIGSHGLHLAFNRDLNYTARSALSTSPARDQAAINLLTSNVANPFQGLLPATNLNGSTVTVAQLLRPYPQYFGDNSVLVQPQNLGYSSYQMLDARLEKRLSHGLQFLVSYSFSKMISAISMLNPSDPSPERRIASEDRPQRFVISSGYQLPFGKGKLLAKGARPWQDALIGGWKVSGIMTIQSGPLLSWGNLIYYGGDLNLDARRVSGAFDTTRFNTVSAQQLANNIRTFPTAFSNLRADGPKNLDLSLQKDFALRAERLHLQYRVEAFNALNHTLFNGPSLTPTSADFGRITGQANISRFLQMSLKLAW
jgi:Carboxypeptidase regulatory-like domain